MHKAIRSQSDDLGDQYSVDSAVFVDPATDRARQEFKDDADLGKMLARFGAFQPQRELQFGDVDYGIDLQMALAAIADAKSAWQQMPGDVKKAFPTWQSLLNALESGEIILKPEPEAVPEVIPEAPESAQ